MKFNTLINYPMTVTFREWEPEEREDRRVYRGYGPEIEVPCVVSVNQLGSLQLVASRELQTFGIITSIRDAGGTPVMATSWYSVMTATPVFDPGGYVSSFVHRIAVLAPELMMEPIDAPQEYPRLDQG